MTFEFAKFTEVTSLAHKVNSEYKSNNYTRIFLCPDVKDIWLARILEGYNKDYEQEIGSFILERNKVDLAIPRLLNENIAQCILEEDDFSNWDYYCFKSMEECIEALDDGYGILNLE